MRWILVALAFAALVAMAIATVAVRTENVMTRARLRQYEHRLMVWGVEHARCVDVLHTLRAPDRLAAQWRQLSRQSNAG